MSLEDRANNQQSLADEVSTLAKLSPLEYDQQRQEVAERLGVRVTTLDDEVKKKRKAGTDTQGGKLTFEDPEDWPDPVDGAKLLGEIATIITKYCVLPEGAATACALFTLQTYCLDNLFFSPILGIKSPIHRCGKTTLLEVLTVMVRRSMPTSNISSAALFRSVEKWQPTLLIDEADSFLKDNEDLRGIINSGHTRASAFVVRTVGDEHEPARFSTWCSKIIAGIGSLPGTVEDRAIVIPLRRKLPSERVDRLRLDHLGKHSDIARKCHRWARDNAKAIRNSDPDLPSGLNDRAADNWRSLFMVADVAGGDWLKCARAAVHALADLDGTDSNIGVVLLKGIKDAFERRGRDTLSSADLVEDLASDPEAPWATWNKGKPMTQRQLANRLGEFRITSKTVRVDSRTPKGYEIAQFEDAFRRYITIPSATTPQSSNGAAFGDFPSATTGASRNGNMLDPNAPGSRAGRSPVTCHRCRRSSRSCAVVPGPVPGHRASRRASMAIAAANCMADPAPGRVPRQARPRWRATGSANRLHVEIPKTNGSVCRHCSDDITVLVQ